MPSSRRRTRRASGRDTTLSAVVPATLVAALVVLCAWLGAASAAAEARGWPAALPFHARMVSSTPADGSTVDSVSEVTLLFSEEVNPDFVVVTVEGPGGDEASGTPSVRGREVTQTLAEGLAAGEHVVTFRVVSADGHPVSGTLRFQTTQDPGASPSTSSDATPSSAPASATPTSESTSPGTTSPASDPTAQGSSMPPWLLVVLGVAVLAGLTGVVLWASPRRGSEGRGEAPPTGP